MKWVLLATAPNEPIARSWAEMLRRQGLPVLLRVETISTLVAGGALPVRLMVPADREAEGKALFNRLVGPWEWQPSEPPA